MQNTTWAKKGTENVYINSEYSEKVGFTFIATVSYDGTKHHLILISKGKTITSEHNWLPY